MDTAVENNKLQNLPHTTNTILMVAPRDFGFNEEAAADNEFQTRLESKTNLEIRQAALKEFFSAVSLIESKGINVIVFDKDGIQELSKEYTPDSVFPNNWLATDSSGGAFIFPMLAQNRRLETHAYPYVKSLLDSKGFVTKRTTYLYTKKDLNEKEVLFDNPEGRVLEGTGSLIFDKASKTGFASLSQRTEEGITRKFLESLGYESILFETESSIKKPFYHTNIVLSIGEKFAVVCSEAIKSEQKDIVLKALENRGKEVIQISLEQTEKYYCGNVIQVGAVEGAKIIVMSSRAFKGFTEEQLELLRKHGELTVLDIDTIETVGGGSARCMICEIFL